MPTPWRLATREGNEGGAGSGARAHRDIVASARAFGAVRLRAPTGGSLLARSFADGASDPRPRHCAQRDARPRPDRTDVAGTVRTLPAGRAGSAERRSGRMDRG